MELKKGNLTDAHGIIFKRVGPDLPVVHGGFRTIPVQALAVSNKFGLTLFVHSSGFCVVRTADLVQASKDSIDSSKDESNVERISLASVCLPDIQILALSKDELTVAACIKNNVHFYRIPSLVQKGKAKTPTNTSFKSILVCEENNAIKSFSWNPSKDDTFMTLSSGGTLSIGHVSADSKVIAEEVEAADWSPDGQFVGYITRNRMLHTIGLDSSTSFSFSLPSEMFGESSDNGSAYVDMMRWVRLDNMLISCVHINADGEEDECWIFVLASSKGHIGNDLNKIELFSFEQFFPSIDASILAPGNGPYVLASQIPPWDVIVAASRRSIDDHISLLGWLQEDGKSEVYSFELAHDRYCPRIELQASGDDNSVVGLAIDQTITSIQLHAPNGDSGEMLPAGPLLLCMTLEGKLSLFSLARTDPKWRKVDVLFPSVELPKEDPTPIPTVLDVDQGRQSNLFQTSPEGQSVFLKVGVSGKEGTSSLEVYTEGQTVTSKVDVLSKDSFNSTSHSTSHSLISSLSESYGLERNISATADAMMPGALQTSAESQSVSSKVGVSSKESTSSTGYSCSQSIPSAKVGASSKESTSSMSHGVSSSLNSLHSLGSSLFPSASANKSDPLQRFTESESVPSKVVGSTFYSTSSVSNSHSANLLSASNSSQSLARSSYSSADASKTGPLNKKKDGDNLVRPSGGMGFPHQRQVHGSVVSEMESDFIKELHQVRTMAKEIDELIAFTEGRASGRKGEHNKVFTKSMLEEIELGIERLYELCGGFKEKLEWQRQSIYDLHDEGMQVDAWRIYVQSLFEQASDRCYQGLWHKHKLHPEMDAMRKRILELDQSLKQQIAELEEHLHNLELSRWGRGNNQSKHQSISVLQNADRKIHHLQSLYNTVNTQMVVAEQLAHRLALQMETLKVSSLEIEGLIGISAERLRYIDLEEQSLTKNSSSVGRLRAVSCESEDFSPMKTRLNHALQTPVKVDAIPGTNVGLQDSPRRRRDSVDRLWIDIGATKTTVKRAGPIRCSEGILQSLGASSRSSVAAVSIGSSGTFSTSSVPAVSIGSSGTFSSSSSPKSTGSIGTSFTTPVLNFTPASLQSLGTSSGLSVPVSTCSASAFGSSVNSTDQATSSQFESVPFKVISTTTTGGVHGVGTSSAVQNVKSTSFFGEEITSVPQQAFPPATSASLGTSSGLSVPVFACSASSFGSVTNSTDQTSSQFKTTPFKAISATTTASVYGSGTSFAVPNVKATSFFGEEITSVPQQVFPLATSASLGTSSGLSIPVSTCSASAFGSSVTNSADQATSSQFESVPFKAISTTTPGSVCGSGTSSAVPNVKATSFFGEEITSVPQQAFPRATSASLGTSSGLSVPVSTCSANAFGSSVTNSADQATSSQFESVPFKAISTTTTSSVCGSGTSSAVPNVKATSFFGDEITSVPQQVFPPTTSASAASSGFSFHGPPTTSDEEEMEEETGSVIESGFSGFGGFGLGPSEISAVAQKPNPFGSSSFGSQPSSASSFSVSTGQLFKPAAFNLPTPQSAQQQSSGNTFGNLFSSGVGGGLGSGNIGFGSPAQPATAFGQPAHPGHGQQALGTALGTFGQTRQIGTPFGTSATGFVFPTASGGFASAATGGGFASAVTGGGFASVVTGGGFTSAASGGGGFAGVSSAGGFAGASGGGGFQSFSGIQGSFGGGPSSIGGRTTSSLFTQMRK